MFGWDQVTFVAFTSIFIFMHLIQLFQAENSPARNSLFQLRARIANIFNPVLSPSRSEAEPTKRTPFYKHVIASFVCFNSSILFVGFISETYLYGARLFANAISVGIGYLIAFLLVQPFMHGVTNVRIKSPYEYFQLRFSDSKPCRQIVAVCAFIFQILFSSLFLLAGSSIVCTLLAPNVDLWAASLVMGVYSTLGVLVLQNGYQQPLKISVLQFSLFLIGNYFFA